MWGLVNSKPLPWQENKHVDVVIHSKWCVQAVILPDMWRLERLLWMEWLTSGRSCGLWRCCMVRNRIWKIHKHTHHQWVLLKTFHYKKNDVESLDLKWIFYLFSTLYQLICTSFHDEPAISSRSAFVHVRYLRYLLSHPICRCLTLLFQPSNGYFQQLHF